jgi:elongation factor 2
MFLKKNKKTNTPLYLLKAYLPVLSSFGFNAKICEETSGRAFLQLLFSHWETIQEDPYEEDSISNSLVTNIRARKNLKEKIPISEELCDKL